jgi:uncharacterized damage-inducible protein DinB
MRDREQRVIVPLDASHPELGRWLWALEDTRARTKETLDGLNQAALDWTGPGAENSIGSLLYHIALIEFDYLYADILGEEYPEGATETLLPFSDRDANGHLSVVAGVSLEDHLARLDEVRRQLLARVSPLTAAELETPRELPEYGYDLSPAWVLHHLMQHEAEHRGQIGTIRTLQSARAG